VFEFAPRPRRRSRSTAVPLSPAGATGGSGAGGRLNADERLMVFIIVRDANETRTNFGDRRVPGWKGIARAVRG
jgi:hypothetical protein